MKYFAHRQRLGPEDSLTALVFGFLRHAPAELGLAPWLTEIFDRAMRVEEPLTPENFWPSYSSMMAGRTRTEPDLVFRAHDGRPVLVIVEVKPSFGQHNLEQIVREAVDTAAAEAPERLALVMVGADLGRPRHTADWDDELREALARQGLGHVEAELRYSSWALLGHHIRRAAEALPDWQRYADDVLRHLTLKNLLGYDGGPMFDDLEELTVVNAVELFNRTVQAARNLLLALHGQPRFQAAGFEPFGGRFAMVRDGTSTALTQAARDFETSICLSTYRKSKWPDGAGVFIAIWLTPDEGDDPLLQAGAFRAAGSRELVWSYASAEDTDEVSSDALARTDKTRLDTVSVTEHTEWVYASRDWQPGHPEEDVTWILDALDAGSRAWDG